MFGVYLPPMLLVVALAAAAVATAHLLNRLRVTRFIAAPPLFLMDMVYAVFFSTFIIRA